MSGEVRNRMHIRISLKDYEARIIKSLVTHRLWREEKELERLRDKDSIFLSGLVPTQEKLIGELDNLAKKVDRNVKKMERTIEEEYNRKRMGR